MNILITGITGFLGTNIMSQLSEHTLCGLGTKTTVYNSVNVYSIEDLCELSYVPDVIIMCHAAISSGQIEISLDKLFNVNVALTNKLVSKYIDAFIIYTSSTSVYDINSNTIIKENSNINPNSNYAISKFWSEKVVLQNKKSAIIRFSSIFGINMKENTLIPNYINQALKNKTIQVWGEGSRKQNYINVKDAAYYIKLIVDNIGNTDLQQTILLGVSQKEWSNLEIAQIISKHTQSQIEHVNLDTSLSYCYNNKLTNAVLDWEPIINLETEISQYISWKEK